VRRGRELAEADESSFANVANTALEASTSSESCWSLPPSASVSSRKLWIERATFAWRFSTSVAISSM
jgi:hypothetical protein